MTKPAVLALLALSSCADPKDPHQPIVRTTDRIGDTCGEWTDIPADGAHQLVTVDCVAPLQCMMQAYYVRSANEMPTRLGICMPQDQYVCSAGDPANRCPSGFGCHSGWGIPDPGLCFLPCQATSDCPAPFQVCSEGGCEFMHCNQDPAAGAVQSCPSDATCDRVLCDHP